MSRYLIQRVLFLIPSLLAVYTITFFLMHATPGGPWDRTGRPLPQAAIDNLNRKYGLDKPLWQQYWDFLVGIVTRGDLGASYTQTSRDVTTILVDFFPTSLKLGAVAMVVAVLGGVGLGVLGAVKHNSVLDYLATFLGVIGISTPTYVVATLFVVIFAVWLGWLPSFGWDGVFSTRIIIPAVALALPPMALLARYTRSSLLDVLNRDYIRTARAKGIVEQRLLVRHALRNALIPVVTVAGIAFAEVVTGSFFVESITGVPGIGRYFVTSVLGRDYPVIMGTTLFFAALIMSMNLLVDLLYVVLDPRLRFD
jgi:ABC-type dipeptide/oligopeptide/nickel transport system permease component